MTSVRSCNHCVFEYMYRDAGNWKTFHEVLLAGCIDAAAEDVIWSFLGGDGFFIAEQVGLPPLQPQHLLIYDAIEDEDLDHAFHEFLSLRPATSEDISAQTVRARLSYKFD